MDGRAARCRRRLRRAGRRRAAAGLVRRRAAAPLEVGRAGTRCRADQKSHGALVLGEPVPWGHVDWGAVRCTVTVGAQPPVVRTGTHALGDRAWLLPIWLPHATRHGDVVPAGTVVTTGTWAGVVP